MPQLNLDVTSLSDASRVVVAMNDDGSPVYSASRISAREASESDLSAVEAVRDFFVPGVVIAYRYSDWAAQQVDSPPGLLVVAGDKRYRGIGFCDDAEAP